MKDVGSFPDVRQEIQNEVGDTGLNLLINNAGMALRDSIDTVSRETMVENFEVNAVSPLLLTKVSCIFHILLSILCEICSKTLF